jgi:hypothetical protein
MLILAAIDRVPPRRHVLRQVTPDHALAACLAIGLNVTASMLVLLQPSVSIGWVGPGSLLLFFGYVAGIRPSIATPARRRRRAWRRQRRRCPRGGGPSPGSPRQRSSQQSAAGRDARRRLKDEARHVARSLPSPVQIEVVMERAPRREAISACARTDRRADRHGPGGGARLPRHIPRLDRRARGPT